MRFDKRLGIKICLITSLAVIAVMVWQFGIRSSAVFDSDSAVHINPDEIENSTLIIGTHLIYIHSLNDEIYSIAQDSASSSGQENIYYKSELADGIWFDITDASSISDISSNGVIVSNDEIAQLDMTHHTKSDGITYDLRTGQAVCIFDIYDVYDLENMEELEPLKLQYDTMKESNSSDKTSKRNLNYVKNFFAKTVTNDITQNCDRQLDALQKYYEELVANDASSSESQMVLKVMSKVDYERRAAVYTIVDNNLESLLDKIGDTSSKDDQKDNIGVDDALMTAIGNSQSNIGESMTQAQGNMLSEGDTVLSKKEYELSNGMISNAVADNFASCDTYNYKLQYLDNINNGKIVDRTNEISLLDEMISSADEMYSEALGTGQTSEYNELVNRNASNAALQSQIKSDVVSANSARSELQFLIQSKTDRMESADSIDYVNDRIKGISAFRTAIKNDDYITSLNDTVDQHLEWLTSLLSEIKSEGTDISEAASLSEQKANLLEQKLEALDNLDLDAAKRIDALIDEIDSQIDKLDNAAASNLALLLEEKSQLESDIANAQNIGADTTSLYEQLSELEALIADNSTDMSSDSMASNIMDAKSQIMDAIAQGNPNSATLDMISSNVELLTSALDSGSALALSALKAVYSKMLSKSELEDEDSYDDLMDSIEEAVADSSVKTSLSGELSVSDVTDVLADSLGIDSLLDEDGNISDDVSDDDLAAVLIALGEFNKKTGGNASGNGSGNGSGSGSGSGDGSGSGSESGDGSGNGSGSGDGSGDGSGSGSGSGSETSEVAAFTDGILSGLNQSGDSLLFGTKKQGDESYVPAKILASYAGYRYVWNDTKKNAILSQGRTYYSFIAFKETVENEKGDVMYMNVPAAFSGDVYIPSSFVEENFGCYVYAISGTNYSVLVNDSVAENSQQLLSELLEKGGY